MAALACFFSLMRFPLAAAGLLLALPAAQPAWAGEAPRERDAAHAVGRLTYGPTPGELARVADMGVSAFIQSQLEPERLDEPPALTEALAGLPAEAMDTVRLFREYGPTADRGDTGQAVDKPGPEAMRRTFDRAGAVALEAAQARLIRAVLSKRQLFELMVAFWSEHFNLGAKKGLGHLWVGSFEREAIRPYAMGRFLDLLAATAMHPAMLIARDNWKNVVHREGDAPPKEELDPGYAATLLAHQTLGPNGPQTPADVTALARVFTGWRVGAARAGADSGGFYFDVSLHDPTDKVFLGETIQGSGLAEGATALRILAKHPATAGHICRKLAVYFLCDDPPAALVSRLAQVFGATGGDIREVLRALFSSPEFFDPKYMGNRLKTPLRQVVSAVRATGSAPRNTAALAGALAGLGQPLFAADGPEGYPATSAPWLKPESLAGRVAFAGDLVSGRLPVLEAKPGGLSATALAETLGGTLSAKTRQAAAKAPAGLGAAVILGSPDFMRY